MADTAPIRYPHTVLAADGKVVLQKIISRRAAMFRFICRLVVAFDD